MIDIKAKLAAMTGERKAGAIEMLDMLTRPLTVREIETALHGKGVTRSRAVIISSAVKGLHIVALIGGEHD